MLKLRILFLLLLCMPLASTIQAQDEIGVGDSVSGNFEGVTVQYEVYLAEGQVVLITLESNDFDAYLEIYDEAGYFLDYNDDFDGLNSRIPWTATYTGIVTIWVISADGSQGNYQLSVQEAEITSQIELDKFAYGDILEFEPDGGALSIIFSFDGEKDDVVSIDAFSEAHEDTTLTLLDSNGDVLIVDEDSGSGLSPALIRFVLPDDDEYTILITGNGSVPIFGTLEISLVETELLLLNDGPQTTELSDAHPMDNFVLNASEEEVYLVTISSNATVYASTYLSVLQGWDDIHPSISLNVYGLQNFSFSFEARDDGPINISLEIYDDETVEVTIETQLLNQ